MRAFILKVMGLVLLIPALATSQTFQGGIRGAVRDADGGVLPGTTVHAYERANGRGPHVGYERAGRVRVRELCPWHLQPDGRAQRLRAVPPRGSGGRRCDPAGSGRVDDGRRHRRIGDGNGGNAAIETANASIASAIDKAQLDVLPTPGRNVFIYSVTTPNVVHTGDPVFVRKQDQTNSSLLSLAGGPSARTTTPWTESPSTTCGTARW